MKKTLFVIVISIILLTACVPGQPTEQTQDQINTAVAAAMATQQKLVEESVNATLTAVAQNASPTPVGPTAEILTSTPLSLPSFTPTPLPTITPLAVNTPFSGGGGGSGGGSSSSAYLCAIVNEKPYDGANFKPGDSFDKSWTIKNTGTATWESNWEFEFRGGTDMSPTGNFLIGQQVKPGGTITLVIEVEAPNVEKKDSGKIFVMTWSLNNGSHFCTPYVAIKVFTPGS